MSKLFLADEVVVEYIKSGGPERMTALEQIHSRPGLRDRIITYVSYHGGKNEDGHDIFIEAILTSERNIRNNRFKEDSTIATYAFGVAKKLWANKLRVKKQDTLPLDKFFDGLTDFQNPELILISEEINEGLLKVIELLSEKCRSVIKLWSNGVKYKDIANELNVENTSQLRKMKYDCQQKLRDELLVRPELIPNYYNGELGTK